MVNKQGSEREIINFGDVGLSMHSVYINSTDFISHWRTATLVTGWRPGVRTLSAPIVADRGETHFSLS